MGEAHTQPEVKAGSMKAASASKDRSKAMGAGGGFKGKEQCDQRAAACVGTEHYAAG